MECIGRSEHNTSAVQVHGLGDLYPCNLIVQGGGGGGRRGDGGGGGGKNLHQILLS